MDKNITIAPKEIAPGVFSTGGTATMPNAPTGWDTTTYQNFKKANPTLEPNGEDTYRMLNAQPNVITPGALAPQAPINLAGTTPTPIVDTSLVANATQGTQAFDTNAEFQRQLELQKQTTPDQTPLNDILASLTASEQGLTGRGNEQLTAETSAGIPEAQKTRATLQGTIKSQLAEYNALKTEFEKMSADIEAGAGRKGLTTGAVMGQQGAVDRAKLARLNSKASEIGLLQAQDQALAGQIETAQNTVNRAIDLKYQDKEAEYQIKKLQYDRIKDSLTAEEKKRGEAMQNALKKEETALAETKANEKAIEKMLLDATPNAPANIIASANAVKQRGGSALEVAQALGKYGGDYLKTELLKQQIETEKAQRSKIYTDIAKTKRETGLLGQPVGVDGVIATLPKSSQERYYKLQGDFDTATKNYRGAIDSAGSITALSKDATPQQQTAIIFQYMKTLDPSSTVREGEFALVGNTAGLGDRAVNALRKLDKGSRLNENQINDIVGATKVLAENAKKNLELTSNEYDRRAVKFGLPKGLFYEEQEMASNTSPEAEAIRAKIKAANPNIGVEKIQGTEIIQNINNGVTSFILPTNPKKN